MITNEQLADEIERAPVVWTNDDEGNEVSSIVVTRETRDRIVRALRAAPAQQPATKKIYVKPLRTIVEVQAVYADQIRDLLNGGHAEGTPSRETLAAFKDAEAGGGEVVTDSTGDVFRDLGVRSPADLPAEPTPEMVRAGLIALVETIEKMGGNPNDAPDEAQKYMQLGSLMRCGTEIKAVYAAMLAARPSPAANIGEVIGEMKPHRLSQPVTDESHDVSEHMGLDGAGG